MGAHPASRFHHGRRSRSLRLCSIRTRRSTSERQASRSEWTSRSAGQIRPRPRRSARNGHELLGRRPGACWWDEFTEVESGKRNDRPELGRALAACKRLKAKLVIAKLDRLSRNLAFIATLMDSGVEFVAVDNPHANKLTIHILAAVAQHEREIISARTSAALKAAKARGKRLGNPKLSDARRHAAAARTDERKSVLRERFAGDP